MRSFIMIAFGLAAITTLNAGQIQIGGSNGISGSYITSGCAGSAVNNGPDFDGCATTGGATVQGTATAERNYVTSLFAGATGTTTVPDGSVNAGVNRTQTETDSSSNTGPVTFNLLNDGSMGVADNDVFVASNGVSNLTIPVGIFDVDKTWTMLNDYYGVNGANTTSVTFNFATDSAGTIGLVPVTVQLVNGQEIRDAVDCVQTGCSTATTLASGSNTINGVAVTASNLYSSSYRTATVAPYIGSSGNVVLDDQEFVFTPAEYLNKYLVSINVNNTSGGGTNGSRAALSAVTVDSTVFAGQAPEPSTMLLFGLGFGSLGLLKLRRSKNSRA